MLDSMIVGIINHFTAEELEDVVEPGRQEEEIQGTQFTEMF